MSAGPQGEPCGPFSRQKGGFTAMNPENCVKTAEKVP